MWLNTVSQFEHELHDWGTEKNKWQSNEQQVPSWTKYDVWLRLSSPATKSCAMMTIETLLRLLMVAPPCALPRRTRTNVSSVGMFVSPMPIVMTDGNKNVDRKKCRHNVQKTSVSVWKKLKIKFTASWRLITMHFIEKITETITNNQSAFQKHTARMLNNLPLN